jgi:murein L,D-transpeptidase YcbB/YkuD
LARGLEALVAADERGLSPEDYDAPLLLVRASDLRDGTEVMNARVLFDLGLSASLLRHLSDVHRGRVDPRSAGFDYDVQADVDLPGLLRAARDSGRLGEEIAGLEPQMAPYRRLKAALAPWRALVKGPPLELAPEVEKLLPGSPYDGTSALAARLRAFGDLPPDAPAPGSHYDGALVEAVKRLQDRMGLATDGTLGPETFRAVNRSPGQCYRQIELALERLRWLPDLRQREFLAVDVPAFLLWAFTNVERPDLMMRVVVGKALRHDTPVFLGELRSVSFAPYWNVPPSIARNEVVPRIRRDPGYLDREGFEIVALGSGDAPAPTFPPSAENLDLATRGKLLVRQRPGPKNALGRVKFSFPNDSNVYMHDTPSRELFARSRRDFSHGCIRLEDPAALARWVLRDLSEWPPSRIAQAMEGDRTVWASLGRGLPVVIFYATAFVDSEGRTRFFDDIYGLDARLEKALAHGYPYSRGAGEAAAAPRR